MTAFDIAWSTTLLMFLAYRLSNIENAIRDLTREITSKEPKP